MAASGPYYHGTKADMVPGDLIVPGRMTNYGSGLAARNVYLTKTLEAAVWGAELAQGDGRGRIYLVEPTGDIQDDPNLTDKKFPGNPTQSYRSRAALRVLGEVVDWMSHSAETLQNMRDSLARLREAGVHAIDD